MTKLERLNKSIAELDVLIVHVEDVKARMKHELPELELTDFSCHMATACNCVDDACDELKKIAEQMEAKQDDSE